MAMSTKEMRTTVADLGDARRSDQTKPPSGTSRNGGIDAQRASLTLLVVFQHAAIMIGGDAFYCAGSLDTIAKLAAEGIPVVGHVGLILSRATWTGGFKAVGKTAVEAMQVFDHVMQLEAAGAVAAEIEVAPARVESEISKRTTLFLMSMGAGSGWDAQYLFAEDVLGYSRGHQPATPKSTATSAAKMSVCSASASRPSRNSGRMSKRALSRNTSTSCRSLIPSSGLREGAREGALKQMVVDRVAA
jgi:hypothetical protein